MNKEKENYPDWLVPLEVGKKLKEIGFDEPCHFYYQNDYSEYLKAGDPDKYHIISDSLTANRKNANHNKSDIAISAPTWIDVFAWFRKKNLVGLVSYRYRDKNNKGFSFEILDEETDIFLYKTYEQAQEALVFKLIEIYKNK